jgi:benzylsuccinate CoA-transferase BbsF subunit
MNRLPLSGVRVVDFTWIGAGSYTTKLLADFGADVIKIESVARLDSLRNSRPYKDGIAGVNRSGYFADRNTSKRSITVNMKSPRGQELVRKLIRTSQVVANNFTPGTMEKFGLGYEDVRAFKPDIVYLAMSMQGADGPERDYLGYGLTIGALTGLQHLCGLPERESTGTGTNFPDHIPNPTHAAFATIAALRHLRRTGQGQFIGVAQTEPTVALFGPEVLDFTANGHVAQRRGNQHRMWSPHGVYPCAGDDRWIAISAGDDARWEALARVLGLAGAGADPRFADGVSRWRHRAELDRLLERATSEWVAEELMTALQAVGVAAGAVRDASDVVRRDPQLAARGHWVRLDHPEMGPMIYNAPPFRLSDSASGPLTPAPLLGQHTREVCTGLGLSEQEIDELAEQGVLA